MKIVLAFTIVSSEVWQDNEKKKKEERDQVFPIQEGRPLSNEYKEELPKTQLMRGLNILIMDNDSSDNKCKRDT